MANSYQTVKTAAAAIQTWLSGARPEAVIILGSGLGGLAGRIERAKTLPYADIPGFAVSTAPGHAGRLICGNLGGRTVLCMAGRMHYYEGYGFEAAALPVQTFAELGIRTLIVTNAAGGVNPSFDVGDLMLITDHIKFFDDSPLRGANIAELGSRFPDMSTAYTPRLRELARRAAGDTGTVLREGVYFYMPGPQFETPAEIRAIAVLGGDAVGMSTAPEVIAAAHAGVDVLGISLISNKAAGLGGALSGEDVNAAAQQAGGRFEAVVTRIIELL